jgi:hypothetical protein
MRVLIGLILTVISCAFFAEPSQAQPQQTQGHQGPPQNSGLPVYSDPSWPVRVFPIRYVDIRYINTLLTPFNLPYNYEPNLRAISVRGPASTLNAIDEIIKRFDIASNAAKNVEVTGYILLASTQSETDDVPAALRAAVDQLRSVMAYKSYRVLDTIIARGNEGDFIQTSGLISRISTDPPFSPTYDFVVKPRVSGDGADQAIEMTDLRLTLQNPRLQIATTISMKKGQQVVVGKATYQDRALILILTAKVVD